MSRKNNDYESNATSYSYTGNNNQYAPPINGGQPHVQVIKPTETENTGWRDLPFAILFILNVIAIGALMVIYGLPVLSEATSSSNEDKKQTHFLSGDDTKDILLAAAALSVTAAVLALAGLKILLKYARTIIQISLGFMVLGAFALAGIGLWQQNFVIGVIGLVFAFIALCYAYLVRKRIPFAAANLVVAGAGVEAHGTLICLAFSAILVEVCWILMWSLAAIGVFDETSSSKDENGNENVEVNGGASYPVYFFMLLSFYWGMGVINNIVHATIAGTVGSWWFNAESKGATANALKRSCTTSLGSICFGSLLVAILETLQALARQAADEGSGLACIAECILGCLRSLLEYFNKWGYVYVGIYGKTFIQASKAVISLFKQRGWEGIIADDLISNALTMVSVTVGLICAGLGFASHYLFLKSINEILLAVLGFLIGFGISTVPMSVISSSVLTVFVCFAEDPNAFAQHHPDLYQGLMSAWCQIFPDVMLASGYQTGYQA